MFVLFDKLNIIFKSSKIYFDYSIISFLKQKINRFEFFTTQKKFVVILRFKFSKTFKDLEIYFDMTDYLRNYVAFYVQKIDVLRQRKIMLLKKNSFNKERVRKNLSRRTSIHDFSIDEVNFYKQLHNFFDWFGWLIHHNSIRILYVDVNDFRLEFEIMIYHLKSNQSHESMKKSSLSNDNRKSFFSSSKRKNVKLIMFLNRMLTSTEKKYWSSELKMIDLIWLIKRIRYFIEAFKYVIIIYTNHVVNYFIARQIKLINSNVNKFNMKLIRAFVYLFQYQLNIRYKSNKKHIISNVFNQLFIINRMFNDKNDVLNIENFHNAMIDSKNDFIYVYQNNLIALSNDFKKRMQKNIVLILLERKF